MADQSAWHNQDGFWELFEPFLFDQGRQAGAQAEVEYLIELLNITKGDRILDLPCGTGRHSLELARQGFQVVGVDRTVRFVEQARQGAVAEHLKVELLTGDMREFCRPESFDVALSLFGSFGYFEDEGDDRQVAQNMYASLRAGGRFLIETAGKEILARDFRERDWSEVGDTLVLSERRPLQNWRRMQTRWIVVRGGKRVEHTVSVRCYSAVELSSLLSDCGFAGVRVCGDLQGTDYGHHAKRLVVIGTK